MDWKGQGTLYGNAISLTFPCYYLLHATEQKIYRMLDMMPFHLHLLCPSKGSWYHFPYNILTTPTVVPRLSPIPDSLNCNQPVLHTIKHHPLTFSPNTIQRSPYQQQYKSTARACLLELLYVKGLQVLTSQLIPLDVNEKHAAPQQ